MLLLRRKCSFIKIHNWRRKWQPTAVFLPEKSHEGRSLATVHGVTPNFILVIFNFSSQRGTPQSCELRLQWIWTDPWLKRKTFIVMMLIDFIYALKTYIPSLVHRKMSHLYTEKSKAIVPMCWEHEKIFFLFFFFKVFCGEKKSFPWLGELFSKMVESEFYRNPVNNFQENFKSKNKYNQNSMTPTKLF